MSHIAEIETKLVTTLVNVAIDRGYSISVYDDYEGDGEWTVKRERDPKVILAALRTTDGDTLRFYDDEGDRIGSVVCIWGNGEDCFSNWSNSCQIDNLVLGVLDEVLPEGE